MKYFALLLCFAGVSLARKLPPFINVCIPKQTDPSACIKENIISLRPRLKDGVSELAIPSMHPLALPFAHIKAGDFEVTFKNLKIWEVHQFDLQEFKLTLEPELSFNLKVKFDQIRVLADYATNGKIMVLQLNGSGLSQINITNLLLNVEALAIKETKNGKEHIVLTSVEVKPEVGDLSVFFQDLFKDNPELTENANKVLNDNHEMIVEEFAPLVVKIFKDFLVGIINNIFQHYSYNVLFPDN